MAGPDIFKAKIAEAILKGLGNLVFDFTFIKVTPGTRTTLTAGTNPTTVNYAVKGFIDTYDIRRIDGTIIKHGDKKAVLLGASFPVGIVPTPNDKLTAESETKIIINVIRDPAGATYECQIR